MMNREQLIGSDLLHEKDYDLIQLQKEMISLHNDIENYLVRIARDKSWPYTSKERGMIRARSLIVTRLLANWRKTK